MARCEGLAGVVGAIQFVAFLSVLASGNLVALDQGPVPYVANDMSQVIRSEIQNGIREEVSKHLQRMQAQEKERTDSQFFELMTDLKELVQGYDAKGLVGKALTTRTAACSTLGVLHEKMDNLTASFLRHNQPANRQVRAHSCSDLRTSGVTVSGVYTIHPRGWTPLQVYCDMTTDGGGWTVFQRRTNDSVDFYRSWLEYANGFGDVRGSHWLGLRAIHHMTHNGKHEMRVDLGDFDGNTRHAMYDFFAVSSEYTKFRMDLGSYTGTAGDAMEHSRDHRFSTKDRDNDNHPNEHCATRYTGGWWYNSCYRANLNGQYLVGTHRGNRGITWNMWLGDTYSLMTTTMMFRPANFN